MKKKYFKLLELDWRDAFHPNKPHYVDFSPLIGRVFEVTGEEEEPVEAPWCGFGGKLVGETLGDWDDGHYWFAYAKVEEVPDPNESLI